jgi:hypothetical protein
MFPSTARIAGVAEFCSHTGSSGGALRQLMNNSINHNTNASTLNLHEINASTRFITGKTYMIVIS